MDLTNEFRVGVPIDEAWKVLTNAELIAPCMPGAQLTEVDGDTFKGKVKIKLGAITAQYQGKGEWVEQDAENYSAVLKAAGRDTRGQGNAAAEVSMKLTADGDGTKVLVVTDLKVTGKVAQFGRGIMADVTAKLLLQFVECLETKILAPADPESEAVAESEARNSAAPASSAASSGPRQIDMPEPEAVSLVGAAGLPVVKRLAPVVIGLFVLWLLLRRRR
ncbi:MAG: SRPBCC family protein [Acidimicrobiales bacterium]